MKIERWVCGSAAALALASGVAVRGQEVGVVPEPVSVSDVARNDDPGFYVRADVDRPDREYHEGEAISVRVQSEADALLYVYYQQADGKVFQIFPNRQQPDNRVRAHREITIPGPDDLFRWRIGPPFGTEVVKVIASRRPITGLDDPALRQKRFNPVSMRQLKGAAAHLSKGPSQDWTEHDIAIQTSPRRQDAPPDPPRSRPDPGTQEPDSAKGRRFGVFFGVDQFRYNPERVAFHRWLVGRGAKIPEEVVERGLSLPACRNDGLLTSEFLKQKGRLDAAQVFIGEEATREQMEQAITRWLPSVSKPGDTVFIYISSHGGQVADDDGDEARSNPGDDQDEYLLPHDCLSPDMLDELRREMSAGKPIDPQARGWIDRIQGELGQWPDREAHPQLWNRWAAQAGPILARRTGISDDEFGHWIQRLDGRQVVVLLDICFSGGFAVGEKGISGGGQAAAFDFLDRELTRLKDLGQRDSALLAASAANQESLTRNLTFKKGEEPTLPPTTLIIEDGGYSLVPISVMTLSLILDLIQAQGPIDLEAAYTYCKDQMAEYFNEVNADRRAAGKPELEAHQPRLYNFCTRKVFIVP